MDPFIQLTPHDVSITLAGLLRRFPVSWSMGCQADVSNQKVLLLLPGPHASAAQAPSLGEFIHYRLILELLNYNHPGPFSGLGR